MNPTLTFFLMLFLGTSFINTHASQASQSSPIKQMVKKPTPDKGLSKKVFDIPSTKDNKNSMHVDLPQAKKQLKESAGNLSPDGKKRLGKRQEARIDQSMGDSIHEASGNLKDGLDVLPNVLGIRKILKGILTAGQIAGFLQRAYGRASESIYADMIDSTDEVMLEGATQHFENIVKTASKISKLLGAKSLYSSKENVPGKEDSLSLSTKILDALSPTKHIQTLSRFLDSTGFTTFQKTNWEKIQQLGSELKQERYMLDIIMNDLAIKVIERQIMKLLQAKNKDKYLQGLEEQLQEAKVSLTKESNTVHGNATSQKRLVSDSDMKTQRGIQELVGKIQKDIDDAKALDGAQIEPTLKEFMVEVTKLQKKGEFLREHKNDPIIKGIMDRLAILEERTVKLFPNEETAAKSSSSKKHKQGKSSATSEPTPSLSRSKSANSGINRNKKEGTSAIGKSKPPFATSKSAVDGISRKSKT